MSQPFGTAAEQREITPDERRRMTRTFVWIVVGFFSAIGLMVAVMSVQGRAAREYGQLVLQAAHKIEPPLETRSTPLAVPCAELLPDKPVPPTVQSCVMDYREGEVSVTLKVEGERQYVVH